MALKVTIHHKWSVKSYNKEQRTSNQTSAKLVIKHTINNRAPICIYSHWNSLIVIEDGRHSFSCFHYDKLAITCVSCLCACLPACLWIASLFPQSQATERLPTTRLWAMLGGAPIGSSWFLCCASTVAGGVVLASPRRIFMLRRTDMLSWSSRQQKRERKWGNLLLAGQIQTSGCAVPGCYL